MLMNIEILKKCVCGLISRIGCVFHERQEQGDVPPFSVEDSFRVRG